MPLFRVELERIAGGQKIRNPFAIRDIWAMPPVRKIIRTWDVKARSAKAVRKLLDEAFEQKLPNVQGFRLRSIARVESPSNGREHG